MRSLEASRRGLTVAELLEAIEADCDQRTLYRDLDALEEAGFPLQKDDEDRRWRLLEPREGGWVVPIDPTELLALALSENLFANVDVSQLLTPLENLRAKLLAMMSPKGREFFAEMRAASIATLKAPAAFGAKGEVLAEIQNAIQEHEVIAIRHHKPTEPAPTDREVEPYAIWFTDGGFYLIGFCRRANDFRHFAIQRILHATRTDESFQPSPNFDPATYAKKGFGAFHGPVTRITLRFTSRVAFLARERRYHHTQRIQELPGGEIDLTMEVAGLPEVAAWVAGFGGAVIPLAPPAFRDMVRERFEGGLASLDAPPGTEAAPPPVGPTG